MLKKLIQLIFGKPSDSSLKIDPELKFLIVGLGNIGAEYHHTRHNIGFDVLDHLAKEKELDFETVKLGDLARLKYRGKQILLLKPSTYMNRSGKALKYWMDKEKVPLKNVLVIVDDIHLDLGILRIRKKGSDGGHNGLKDIHQQLGHTNYNRLRFGIGRNFFPGQQVDYVLGNWTEEEMNNLKKPIERASQACLDFVGMGLERAMNKYSK